MASVSTYLNFTRRTEEAFLFYQQVFGTEFDGPIMRRGDIPEMPGQPPIPDADKHLVMHVSLPILAGHRIMGTDALESMGELKFGDNMSLNLQPDTRRECDELFLKLAEGGQVEFALQEMFWGDYWGSLRDRFGVQWMFNCASKT